MLIIPILESYTKVKTVQSLNDIGQPKYFFLPKGICIHRLVYREVVEDLDSYLKWI